MDHRTKEALRYLGYGRNPGEERTLELIRQSLKSWKGSGRNGSCGGGSR